MLTCGLACVRTFGPWGCAGWGYVGFRYSMVLWLHRGCVGASRTPSSLFHTLSVLVLTVMQHHYLFAVLYFAAGITLKCTVCHCTVQRDCGGALEFGVVWAGCAVHGARLFVCGGGS
jgi:hypothetical protein